jgi:pathogenesis-related protein 1
MTFLLQDMKMRSRPRRGEAISAAALAGLLSLFLAACATQAPAPVTPPAKKPAASATTPPAPKPAAPAVAQPAPKAAEPRPEVPPTKLGATRMPPTGVQAITVHHNKVRAAVGVGPLKWSPTLATYSQKWADQLAGSTCKMEHRSDSQYGENIYTGTAGHFTAVDAAKAWESEKKLYAGGVLKQSNWKPAGHYTQMVWRETRMLGCGEATCNKMLIVVCNYDPPGNYIGRKPY